MTTYDTRRAAAHAAERRIGRPGIKPVEGIHFKTYQLVPGAWAYNTVPGAIDRLNEVRRARRMLRVGRLPPSPLAA